MTERMLVPRIPESAILALGCVAICSLTILSLRLENAKYITTILSTIGLTLVVIAGITVSGGWAKLIEGAGIGLICVISSVIGMWWIVRSELAATWYVPVSWLVIGLTLCIMVLVAVLGGWVAATSFTMTYMTLTVVPLAWELHVEVEALSVDALSVILLGAIFVSVELLFVIIFKYLSGLLF